MKDQARKLFSETEGNEVIEEVKEIWEEILGTDGY